LKIKKSTCLVVLLLTLNSWAAMPSGQTQRNDGGQTQGFAPTEDEARPWTFWYWMYGAVSKPGIKADLQAMKDVGLGGCYLMPIRGTAEKPEFEGTAQQLSPQFWEMVDYAMQQADSLGLLLGLHICDGFALAGGPWIKPEESMQQVVWSDTVVSAEVLGTALLARYTRQGAVCFDACPPSLLPSPPVPHGSYYEDIAVFACPVWGESLTPSSVGGTIARDEKGTFRAKETGYIEYDYGHPVTVRSIEVAPSANNIQSQRLLVQASDDGMTFRDVRQLVPPRQGWQNTSPQMAVTKTTNHYTYSLPETTARHFRFLWSPEGTEPGAEDLDAAKWSPVLKLNDLRLSPDPVIDQYESKNGSFWRIPTSSSCPSSPSSPSSLSSPLPSSYRLLRFGHTTTNHTNATAGGGKGLECDKFSVSAVNKQIDGWFGEFMKRPHHDVVRYMHVDSWECGSQNWSRNFAEEFLKRRGYDLLPFLPVYAGVPIDDTPEAKALRLTSDQVLRDIRLTINDLLQDVFFATVKQRAEGYGLQLSCESVAPTMVSDGMEHYRYADLPMGEYWLNSPTHDKPNDMLDAISGAHVYGKRIVQAEGFTEVRGVWDETPASLKTLVDRNLAMGMNRLFFHVFTHNPWTDCRPGMTLDGIGLFFQRDQTWFPEARAFVDYVTRCQRWLQRGWPVVDIAVYTGDEMPRRAWRPEQLADILPGLIGADRVAQEHRRRANVGVPMEESPVGVNHNANIADHWVNALNGYCYDSMNPDALSRVVAGTKDSPTGWDFSSSQWDKNPNPWDKPRWPVIVIPQGTLVLEKAQAALDSLRLSGTTIIDTPWRQSQLDGLFPDAMLPPGIAFCHRRDGKADIYFLSNQEDSLQDFTATFRVHGKSVIVYDPMTDSYTSPVDDIIAADTLTVVRLVMQPRQSLFVLFGATGLSPRVVSKWTSPLMPGMSREEFRWRLGRRWQMTFAETGRQMKSDSLFLWANHVDNDVRYYSGHVRYSNTIDIAKSSIANRQSPVVLSLGEVCDVAHVWVNGHDCGILWMPPYELEIGSWLRPGKNTLEIEVVNTWHNALRGLDQGTPPFPGIWTNARYRTKGDGLLPAGLLGPVELRLSRQ
jgi:hypothetical protein